MDDASKKNFLAIQQTFLKNEAERSLAHDRMTILENRVTALTSELVQLRQLVGAALQKIHGSGPTYRPPEVV